MSGRARRAALLAARREALVALSELQRQQLSERVLGLATPIGWIDRAREALRYARVHPWLVIVPTVAIVALRPRWVWRAVPAAIALLRVGSLR
jgi:hypothetical protein